MKRKFFLFFVAFFFSAMFVQAELRTYVTWQFCHKLNQYQIRCQLHGGEWCNPAWQELCVIDETVE
jgi:hypothetical protein